MQSVATWHLRVPLEDVEPLRHRLELSLNGLEAPRQLPGLLGPLRLEGVLRRTLLDNLLRLLRLPHLVGLPQCLQPVVEHLASIRMALRAPTPPSACDRWTASLTRPGPCLRFPSGAA